MSHLKSFGRTAETTLFYHATLEVDAKALINSHFGHALAGESIAHMYK